MSKRALLKLSDDLDGNLKALLSTPPPPHSTPGSRKAAPKAARGGVRVKGEAAPLRDPEAERQAEIKKATRARLRKAKVRGRT
ncbi:MAG: hypothetical protein U0P30_12160 [Vicinamibacterales bacterium]